MPLLQIARREIKGSFIFNRMAATANSVAIMKKGGNKVNWGDDYLCMHT